MLRYFVVAILFANNFNHLIADDVKLLPKETAVITSDNWCPYACLDTDVNKGLMVDIVTSAFSEVGIKTEYHYRESWSRAIQNVKYEDADILLAVDNENSDYVELVNDFYIYDETVFAILKGSKVVINEGKDLLKYKIGVLAEYGYDDGGPWEEFIENHPVSTKISVSNGASQLLNILQRGRIDVAVVNFDVAKAIISNNEQFKKIVFVRKNVSSKLFVGFAYTERGQLFKNKFIAGFNRLKGTKSLENIYKKYNIEQPDF